MLVDRFYKKHIGKGDSKFLNVTILTLRVVMGAFFMGLALFALSAPIIQSSFGYPSGESIYSDLSPICHQYPTRSFWIMNRPMALCSRCFGGYFGVGFGLLLISTKMKYLKSLVVGVLLVIPGILDGLIQLGTQYESTNIIRFSTGLIGGIGVLFLFFPFKSNSLYMKGTKK